MRQWLYIILLIQTMAWAKPVEIINHSFEADQGRLKLENVPWTGNIEGWNSDENATDSGVDVRGSALVTTVLDGNMYAFIKGVDPVVWQTTAHTISYGEVFTLTFDAFNCWGGPTIVGSLYYLNGAGERTILASATVTGMLGGIPAAGSLTYVATGERGELGHLIGVVFDNPEGVQIYSYSAFDNVRLDVASAFKAVYPSPPDGATDVICRDVLLSWNAGLNAVQHDVYLGVDFDDVNAATPAVDYAGVYMGRQDSSELNVPALEPGRTYYWRIDEVDAGGSIAKGTIWSFTVEPYSIPVVGITATASSSEPGLGPELTVDGSGLTGDKHSAATQAMWQSQVGASGPVWIQYAFDRVYKLDALKVWNYNGNLEFIVGFGLKDVTVEYSIDGVNWTVLGDFVFAQGPSAAGYIANTTVDFSGVTAQYVRLVVNRNWSGTDRYGLSEVRFLYVPTYPRQPDPVSGATRLGPDVVLSWRAGRAATSHGIYVSPDEEAVTSGVALVDTVAENRYELSGLDLGTTYYWKIEEINEASASWMGEVWHFTTRELYAVEDFESYNDDEDAGTTVWQTWIDGVGTNHNGGQAGHNLPPYSEGTVVHSGRQSLPFYYANSGSITRSEAVRTFAAPQDWTRSGIRFLVVYFRGQAENTVGQMYVKINETKVIYAGAASDLTKAFWIPWIIDLSTVGANLASVRSLTLGIENSGAGMVYFDDIRLYRLAPALAQAEVWFEAEAADSIRWPMQVYSDREDASGGQYIATFGTNSTGNPPDNGVASYPVKLAGGTYRIVGRVIAPTGNDDSFWVRLQGATTNTANHVSGWVQWGLDTGDEWHEVPVRSVDDDNATVLFTVEPGIYNLQIAFREDGALLDNWIITKELQ